MRQLCTVLIILNFDPRKKNGMENKEGKTEGGRWEERDRVMLNPMEE